MADDFERLRTFIKRVDEFIERNPENYVRVLKVDKDSIEATIQHKIPSAFHHEGETKIGIDFKIYER